MIKLKSLLENVTPTKLVVYHGTNIKFRKFSLKKSVQGLIWFTSKKENIVNGDVGAAGKGIIITAEITFNKPAGWREYSSLGLWELEREGYDGAILPNDRGFDCFVMSPKQIKMLKAEKIENAPGDVVKNKLVLPKKISEITDQEREEMYPEDSDKWDDWQEYIDHFDYECLKLELSKLIKRFDLQYDTYFEEKIVKLTDDKNTVWLIHNKENETFDVIKDIHQWIYDRAEQELEVDVDIIYSRVLESTLKDFKNNPIKVYHYTTPEKLELIKTSGKMVGSYGTGINNRGAYGIFTTVNVEEYQDGTYGDVCLEIDLPRFKLENNIPELNAEYEPEVSEYLIHEYIGSTLEIDFNAEIPSDMSPYTLIINHTIPIKYIKQL